MKVEKIKIAIIKMYNDGDSYCDFCDRGSNEILQHGVENWLEIDRNDIYKYSDAINKANSYRRGHNFKYILLEQSEDMVEFIFKDADDFLKKRKKEQQKQELERKKQEEKDKVSKVKREVTRMKKNLKKLNFSQEEIDSKIEETYGKEFI